MGILTPLSESSHTSQQKRAQFADFSTPYTTSLFYNFINRPSLIREESSPPKQVVEEEAMAASSFSSALFASLLLFFFFNSPAYSFDLLDIDDTAPDFSIPIIRPAYEKSTLTESDVALLEFALNLEYLQAEFFLSSSLGQGLDHVAPNLTMGGPAPLGATKANLDSLTADIATQFAYQGIGHLRLVLLHFPSLVLMVFCLLFKKFGWWL